MSGAGAIRYGKEDPNYDESCPLCRMEKKTEWIYEDRMVVVCRCETHPDKWIAILRRHVSKRDITPEELQHLMFVFVNVHPDRTLLQVRHGERFRDHFHLHEV